MFAHHAFSAEFDANRPIKLRATVTKMDWVNPHAWIYVDVKGADGKVTSWMIEAAAPNAMIRRGFSRESLPPGSEIIIEGYVVGVAHDDGMYVILGKALASGRG